MLESKKLWIFYLNKFNYKLNKLGWYYSYNYRLCGFYNGYYKFSRLNKFNLDVVNYLIQIGFRFFLDATMYSCRINLFSTSTPNLI
jgi:hypothetical protein